MAKNNNLTSFEAFELANAGYWVSNGGWTWRNTDREAGEYWAYGEYPACVRGCRKFTLESFSNVPGSWSLLVPTRV